MTTSPYGGLKAHPLADAFPMMDEAAYQELVADIREHGLQDPIVVFEGQILDGRNRKKATQELGIPAKEVEYHGDDPSAWVWSKNAVRRQLDGPSLKLAAAKLANVLVGRHTDTASPIGEKVRTREEVAKLTGVPARQIDKAKRVLKEGTDKVKEAFESGALALDAAERLAQKSKEEQDEIMKLPIKEVAKAVPDPRAAAPTKDSGGDAAAKLIRENPRPLTPKSKLTRHMDVLQELHLIRGVFEDWDGNQSVIADLDQVKLAEFVKELKSSRTYFTRLITLIEKVAPEGPAKVAVEKKSAAKAAPAKKAAAPRVRKPAAKKAAPAAAKKATPAPVKAAAEPATPDVQPRLVGEPDAPKA